MVDSASAVMVVAMVIGSSKGFRTVFYHMIIPDSVPQERLASAIGMQAVLNGIIFLVSGPLIGERSTGAAPPPPFEFAVC